MIIDGKAIAEQIQNELKGFVQSIEGRKPCLAVILVGDHPPSQIYVGRKMQACANVGIISKKIEMNHASSEAVILAEIDKLNADDTVDGILVQLPLPPHVSPFKIMRALDPNKDVDGFHPLNVGRLFEGQSDGFFPCTPLGIRTLLERSGVETAGKHALVIGRSNIVGKPMAAMLLQNSIGGNATVTVAHSYSRNIKELGRMADILIAAIGKPRFVTADMIKEGAVIIDVGTNKIANPAKAGGYQIVGDVDFENVKEKCSLITPVPGGVGPMTIAMLLSNTVRSFQRRRG
jgi:methylenetetrahydrofolate dehydrogenase (NADP+)/methenyltetrahydrofolate cyclohydrolase